MDDPLAGTRRLGRHRRARVTGRVGAGASRRRRMLRTSDRGRTWRHAGTAPSMPSFPTRRVGFAMRSREKSAGPLMKTTDGGRSWSRVGAPCRKGWGGYAQSALISFVSPRRGWVLCKGQPSGGGQSKALYLTTDGGTRWKRLWNAFFEPGRVRLGTMHSGYAGGMTFTRRGRGLLWSTRGHTLRTRDGGRSWAPSRRDLTRGRERPIRAGSSRIAWRTCSSRTTRPGTGGRCCEAPTGARTGAASATGRCASQGRTRSRARRRGRRGR